MPSCSPGYRNRSGLNIRNNLAAMGLLSPRSKLVECWPAAERAEAVQASQQQQEDYRWEAAAKAYANDSELARVAQRNMWLENGEQSMHAPSC